MQRSNLRIGERNYNRVQENLAKWAQDLVQIVTDQESTVVQLAGISELKHKAVQLGRELLTLQVSLSLRFRGISLYIFDFLFHMEWYIRQLSCPSIIFCNITSIAHDHHTDIYPLLNIYLRADQN